ncbi:IclR family transcriptional regulator [Pigmentiphaga soli]|uniref:IclR family transcriptional regulator n=1 Tax=Pigmentiphaga soli TaxID=1007095 RepID=A0ABP8GE30_9BURK
MKAATSAAPKTGDGSPRSLMRILGIFDTIAKTGDGMTLAQLSAALASPKSSLLLLLRPLVANEYLLHEGGLYRLGPGIFRLASNVLSGREFPKLIRPYLEQLAERTGESVFLAAIDHNAQVATYVECIDSPQAVRYSVPPGTVRPLYTSAAGRLLLAFQDDAWRDAYLKSVKLKPLTRITTVDRTALKQELLAIRKAGVAVSIGEAVEGAAGVAAPVFDPAGTVSHALMVAAPVDRFKSALPALKKAVIEIAQSASSALGR